MEDADADADEPQPHVDIESNTGDAGDGEKNIDADGAPLGIVKGLEEATMAAEGALGLPVPSTGSKAPPNSATVTSASDIQAAPLPRGVSAGGHVRGLRVNTPAQGAVPMEGVEPELRPLTGVHPSDASRSAAGIRDHVGDPPPREQGTNRPASRPLGVPLLRTDVAAAAVAGGGVGEVYDVDAAIAGTPNPTEPNQRPSPPLQPGRGGPELDTVLSLTEQMPAVLRLSARSDASQLTDRSEGYMAVDEPLNATPVDDMGKVESCSSKIPELVDGALDGISISESRAGSQATHSRAGMSRASRASRGTAAGSSHAASREAALPILTRIIDDLDPPRLPPPYPNSISGCIQMKLDDIQRSADDLQAPTIEQELRIATRVMGTEGRGKFLREQERLAKEVCFHSNPNPNPNPKPNPNPNLGGRGRRAPSPRGGLACNPVAQTWASDTAVCAEVWEIRHL